MFKRFRPFKALHIKSQNKKNIKARTPLQRAQMEYAKKQKEENHAEKTSDDLVGSSTGFSIEEKIGKTIKKPSFPKLKEMFNRNKQKSVPSTSYWQDGEEKRPKSHSFLYIFFICGFLATGYLLSPYGHVNQVHVSGDTQIPEQSIIDASHITNQKTMVGIIASKNTIVKAIEKELPQIKKIEISWQGLNDISLSVQDFQTIAYIENESGYQSVLENGEVLKNEETIPRGSKTILKKFKNGPILDSLVTELNKISEEIQNSISDISYTGNAKNPYTIIMFMNDGNQIKANLRDFSNKIKYYPDILNQIGEQKGIIDMEVGVFFQPFKEAKDSENSEVPIDLEIVE